MVASLGPEQERSDVGAVLSLDCLIHHLLEVVVADVFLQDINPHRLCHLANYQY